MAAAQTDMNAVAPHEMSLQDCIQEALQHNLDMQIERYNPQISLYNLRAAYGGYDPTLNIAGQHSYNVAPSGVTQNQIQTPAFAGPRVAPSWNWARISELRMAAEPEAATPSTSLESFRA